MRKSANRRTSAPLGTDARKALPKMMAGTCIMLSARQLRIHCSAQLAKKAGLDSQVAVKDWLVQSSTSATCRCVITRCTKYANIGPRKPASDALSLRVDNSGSSSSGLYRPGTCTHWWR